MRTAMPAVSWVFLVFVLSSAAEVRAATWRVEKDGSGDFTVIQDALDAAAPGDSVLVGPGRFHDFREGVSLTDGFRFQAIAWINKPGIVLSGAGASLTTIGPDSLLEEFDGLTTGGVYFEGEGCVVEGLRIENLFAPTTIRVQSTMQDCVLVRRGAANATAVLNGVGSVLRRCEYLGSHGVITGSGGVRDLLVEDCRFSSAELDGISVTIGNGARECWIRNCSIVGGASGIQFSFSSSGYVEDCSIRGVVSSGINMSSGAAVVRNTFVGATRMPLRVGSGRLEVYDSEIEGGSLATALTTGQLFIRNSHILNGGALTLDCSTSVAGWFVDVSENWWGTTDEALIRSWISDPNFRVTYQPILTAPVPAESESVGSLKARYRSRQ